MNLVAQTDDTIAAIASSHDVAGYRGILRICGPATVRVVQAFFQPTDPECRWDADSSTRRIPGSVELTNEFGVIPCDVLLWPGRRSYTRQPTVELHTYGALPVLRAILERTCESGARLAEPGEFTLRSFLSGRIDLAQAEAVLGVIDAVNDREVDIALSQLAGGLSLPLDTLRNTLMNLVADLEAGLDFVEEDIEFVTQDQVLKQLEMATQTINATQGQLGARNDGDTLPRVVLYGEPNAGKSSLWNALVENGNAIVDDTAGTTRDYLVGKVQHLGGEFLLIDTAGVESKELRDEISGALSLPNGPEESHNWIITPDSDTKRETIREAMRDQRESQLAHAHLSLFCLDCNRQRTDWERRQCQDLPPHTLVVGTKADLLDDGGADFRRNEPSDKKPSDKKPSDKKPFDVVCSSFDASSMTRLAELCSERLAAMQAESGVVSNTAIRCRESLRLAGESIERARMLVQTQAGDELVVSELRTGLDQLGLIVGAIYNDDILDRVFSRFCIGK